MPDERLRAIGWGEELLQLIASDSSLPKTTKAAAQRIALTYPAPQLLQGWLQSGVAGLPPDWIAALFEALALFDEIGAAVLGSPRTRTELKYTMRHFPDHVTIRVMSRAPGLDQWLQLLHPS